MCDWYLCTWALTSTQYYEIQRYFIPLYHRIFWACLWSRSSALSFECSALEDTFIRYRFREISGKCRYLSGNQRVLKKKYQKNLGLLIHNIYLSLIQSFTKLDLNKFYFLKVPTFIKHLLMCNISWKQINHSTMTW